MTTYEKIKKLSFRYVSIKLHLISKKLTMNQNETETGWIELNFALSKKIR